MDKTTQTADALRIMKRRWLTPMEALREFGCFRLAARVYDLEQQGWAIERRRIEREGKMVMAYRIEPISLYRAALGALRAA